MSRKDHGPETQGPRHAFDTDPPGGPTPDASSIGGKHDTYRGAGRSDSIRSLVSSHGGKIACSAAPVIAAAAVRAAIVAENRARQS